MLETVKILTADLEVGMYVSSLDRPWLETPFLLQGFLLESATDIQRLQQYCQYVFVDTAKSKQGYTTLGDVGYVDEEGWLYLTDRKAFMIISGGVNIYPQETENCLIIHPKVTDVAVIGVPNEDFGEEVKAIVQPAEMADAGPELAQELMDWCRERISHVKCPRSVDFLEELPRHPTGKLYKRLLKDRYWGSSESRIV